MTAMKRFLFLLGVVMVIPASAAPARAFDAKALARYDLSYGRCEARFPAMKGHRDEAYLDLWRIRADDKASTRLADVRGGTVYKAEHQLVLRGAAKAATPAASSAAIERQCQGLWAEHQRVGSSRR